MELKDRLKLLRNEKGLSMDMLVWDMNMKYQLELNKGLVSRWENGINEPSLRYASYLAQYFDVSLDYLTGLTDVKTPARLLAYASRQRTSDIDSPIRMSLSERAALTTRPEMAPRPGIAPNAPISRPTLKLNHDTTSNDDDFEFEFLNLDDEDSKKRKK